MKVTAATGSFVDLEIKKMIRNSLERLSRHDLDNRITRGEACRGTGMLVSHAAGRLELNPMRMDPAADHGALNGLARHRVNVELIARNWDDLLRVAGSLARGTIGASELIGTLLGSSRPSTLTRVIGELGRVAKTLYLLSYLDDETYRRRILRQLNRGESRHGVARAIFHGQRGEVRQRYREGQEDQLGALGLVVNVVVLWNTLYMDAALAHLRRRGVETMPEDVARLSPLGHENINFLGRYSFALSESVARGELRPLHDPEETRSQAEPNAA